ncbi:hypothetical protein T265_00018 [Opisthorchis viverrini]|uniref:Integrase catalytic domain-containing protein n=1 Tax=Opisthorchis viverrini TaxID=6198 RepID=A0A075A473_OPIVI|nr:hypothetical protein T265_00018 [Opisthorchis viverrini]KER34146.1 hypothetical protein T265_00018 [Opisthorchis viverrini]
MEHDGKPTYMKPYSYMEEALCKAAADGNLAAASRIMHERIDPNCKDAVGRSPMHYAALNGHFEIIRLLLCNRALVDVSDANNVTPLHLAARNDHLRCAQLLCMAGADISRTCASGCTPRDLAPFDSQTCYFLERSHYIIPDRDIERGLTTAPESIVFDNGTRFNSHQFSELVRKHGIIHATSSPLHPESNGQAERFVDTFKRALTKTEREGTTTEVLDTFLLNYRATPNPQSPDGRPPAEVMMNRRLKLAHDVILPTLTCFPSPTSGERNIPGWQPCACQTIAPGTEA